MSADAPNSQSAKANYHQDSEAKIAIEIILAAEHKLMCSLFNFKMKEQSVTFTVLKRCTNPKSPLPSTANCLCLMESRAQSCLPSQASTPAFTPSTKGSTTSSRCSLLHCQNLSIDLLQCTGALSVQK